MESSQSAVDFRTKLVDLGFESYVEKFIEEDIDWNTLMLMKDDSLKSVIPKAGPRSRLMNCLRQHAQGNNNNAHQSSDILKWNPAFMHSCGQFLCYRLFADLTKKYMIHHCKLVGSHNPEEGNTGDMVAWLNIHHQPQSKVLEYWRKTAKHRLNYIHGESVPGINEVCATWPRYCDKEGFLLIGEDFSRLYCGKEEKLSSEWMQVFEKGLDKLIKLKPRDKVLEKVIASLKEESFTGSSNGSKMTAAIYALPLLLPEACVSVMKKTGSRKRITWKPTVLETMKHFIDVQKPGIDLEAYLEEKASLLQRYDLNVQPHVIVISSADLPILRDESVSYAVVSGKLWYRTSSTLEAVDACMKAAFVFGIKFPDAARSSWLFLQRAIYGISTKFDSAPSKVLELMSELGLN